MWKYLAFSCVLLLSIRRVNSQCQPTSAAAFLFPPVTQSGLAAQPIFGNLSTPRGITFDSHNTLLVIERGVGVTAFVEKNDSTCVGWERSIVVSNPALTQGIDVEGKELYVSSQLQVLLYKYDPATLSVSGNPTVVVNGLPADGDLTTRTLLVTPANAGVPRSILVSDGPLANLDFTAQDPANGRSQIRRFALGPATSFPPRLIPSGGYGWTDTAGGAELIAFGIRNGAGLALGPGHPNDLWVVENGASLNAIIGDDLSTNDPADELDLVNLNPAGLGKFYGFPFCHTGFAALPPPFDVVHPGDQFSINSTTAMNNTFCRNVSNNVPPRLLLQPHSAPLDIKFYEPHLASIHSGLPLSFKGDGFASFHGSTGRTPPTGYGVIHIPWAADGSAPIASPRTPQGYSFLVQAPNLNVCPNQCIRPVGLAFDRFGRLFVSSDSTGELFFVFKQ